MNTPDEFFQPEKIDEQIEQLRRQPLAGNGDAELIAYLHNVSATDATQERETLNRMWERVVNGTPGVRQAKPGKGAIISMQEQQTLRSNAPAQKQNSSHGRRWGILAAVLILTVLVSSMTVIFNTLHRSPTSPNATEGKPSGVSSPSVTTYTSRFQVIGVDMQVNPSSIADMSCGANITVRYTANFHITPHSPGGTVQFEYTVNNGRSQKQASLTFGPGETTKSYTFSWSGALPADHTYPAPGGVEVTQPNHLISQLIAPSGTCTQSTAFKVLSIDMTVNPASIAGLHCGTSLVVTYKVTFHVAANSPGGTVHFEYTINNGRGSTPASLMFKPGETTRTFSFTWSGNLPPDHTYPGPGGVITTSPNAINSQLISPTGQCN